jgi:hypothetical protein
VTPEMRSVAARIGAYSRWATCEDRTAALAPALKAFNDKWSRLADPNNELSEFERTRRGEALKKAHFQRMALASAKSRARKRRAA